jgi:CRISPR/Cas system-associated protein Cas10 (large subunit of type III CRISPR-Cas system)
MNKETFDPRVSYNKSKDSDVKYTGTSYPDLGINNGDKLSDVLNKIATKLSDFTSIEKRLSSLEAYATLDSSAIKANSLLFDLVDYSEVVSHSLEDKSIDVEVSNSSVAGKVDITFDFAEALDSLDSK